MDRLGFLSDSRGMGCNSIIIIIIIIIIIPAIRFVMDSWDILAKIVTS